MYANSSKRRHRIKSRGDYNPGKHSHYFYSSSEKTGIGLFRLSKERKIRNKSMQVIILKYIQTKGAETTFLLNSI